MSLVTCFNRKYLMWALFSYFWPSVLSAMILLHNYYYYIIYNYYSSNYNNYVVYSMMILTSLTYFADSDINGIEHIYCLSLRPAFQFVPLGCKRSTNEHSLYAVVLLFRCEKCFSFFKSSNFCEKT